MILERKIIDEVLTRLCLFIAGKYDLSTREALAAVSHSSVANEICSHGLSDEYSFDDLARRLTVELSSP